MAYVDTSVLVAATTNESRTTAAQRWLVAQSPDQLRISAWTVTEFSAALSMKVRMQQLDEATRADVLAVFSSMVADSFEVLPVTNEDFMFAAQLADRHDSGLRAGDALHLGVASHARETIVSLDRTLVKAALAAGIRAKLL